jgi:hypothetical protein
MVWIVIRGNRTLRARTASARPNYSILQANLGQGSPDRALLIKVGRELRHEKY